MSYKDYFLEWARNELAFSHNKVNRKRPDHQQLNPSQIMDDVDAEVNAMNNVEMMNLLDRYFKAMEAK